MQWSGGILHIICCQKDCFPSLHTSSLQCCSSISAALLLTLVFLHSTFLSAYLIPINQSYTFFCVLQLSYSNLQRHAACKSIKNESQEKNQSVLSFKAVTWFVVSLRLSYSATQLLPGHQKPESVRVNHARKRMGRPLFLP